MSVNISNFVISSYRNSENLVDFQISNNFVYIICSNYKINNENSNLHFFIDEYRKNNPERIRFSLNSHPIYTFLKNNIFFICSKDGLYFIDKKINFIMSLKPLTLNFLLNDKIFSISENVIKIANIPNNTNKIDENLKILKINNNGLCSSYCIVENYLLLGFENGTVISLGKETIDEKENDSYLETKYICTINEPVLNISKYNNDSNSDNFIYILSLNCIYRYNLNDNTKIYTKDKSKNLLIYKNILICHNEKLINIFDINLNHLKSLILQLDIVNIKISENSLYVGFDCGLLLEYDLLNIYNELINYK